MYTLSFDGVFTGHLSNVRNIVIDSEPQLTEEQRALLVRKIEIDIELNDLNRELLPALLDAAREPSKEKDEAVAFLTSVKLSTLRREKAEITEKLLKSAIDLDKLKQMLPMALMALYQGVNLPLLLKLFDVDADKIEKFKEVVKKYLTL